MTRSDEGFTLMEALLGLLILTLGLTAVLSAFSGGIDALRVSESRERAVETARSLIEESGVTYPLKAQIRDGWSAEGLRWRIVITPYASDATTRPKSIDAYWITVSVDDGHSLVRLTTMKIGS